MVLMKKNDMKKFVPDVFVEKYKADGYVYANESCNEQPSLDSASSSEDNAILEVPTCPPSDSEESPDTEAKVVSEPEASKKAKNPAKKY